MVLRRSLLLLIALLLPTIAFATTTYVVKKGDNLYDLSRKHGVSVEDIKTLNKLDSINLVIGNELLIPSLKTDGNNKYVVKSGDTVSQIAESFGIKSKDLKTANNLRNDHLKIGQTLLIPSINKSSSEVVSIDTAAPKKVEAAPSVKKEKAKTQVNTGVYTVKKGDTLGHIAETHNVRTKSLKEANNLKIHNLRIGQKLVIPNSVSVNQSNNTSQIAYTEITVSNIYRVNKGDTIYEISNKFQISKDKIKKWNNLESNNLRIGQELYLTPNKNIMTKSERAQKKLVSKFAHEYKVKKGDTLGHIATKHKISVSELKSANNLSSNNLSIGKVLKVPATAKKDKVVAKNSKTQTKKPVRTTKIKYIVKKGDTLGGIASRHGISVKAIKQASSLKNNNIRAGSVLLIPGTEVTPNTKVVAKKAVTQKKTKKVESTQSSGPKYSVVTGDTLGKIAGQFGVTASELKAANNLTKNDLYVGMKLTIPSKSSVKPNSTQTAKKPVQQRKSASKPKSNTKVNKDLRIKEEIIKTAKRYLGAPYKFGGYSYKTGIDCSGYVKKIFGQYNIELPRTARAMFWHAGTKVSKQQLQTGDLVFFTTYAKFPSHVGIYLGNGQFIHASSGARKVAITSLNKKYYQKRYIGAKRIPVSTVFEKEYSQK